MWSHPSDFFKKFLPSLALERGSKLGQVSPPQLAKLAVFCLEALPDKVRREEGEGDWQTPEKLGAAHK